MVNFEKLNFSFKLLSNVVLIILVSASEGDESITLDDGSSFDLECRHLQLLRLLENVVNVSGRFGLARISLISSGKGWMRINCNLIRKFILGGFSHFIVWLILVKESIAPIFKALRNITNLSWQSALLILRINIFEVEARNGGQKLLGTLLLLF